ncbi:iron permease [Epithele typhae]|uniref:iron permease n=1 Tax=Epithele typhae TaxID=378194 RepID=UPI0020085BE1|nr:iron permease [Epithele typhae]XP_047878333.1 iron permease [Epithele typhae]KAH9933611.1 iron permease [Epithele typhae]KAH9933614.1 iron permease [Epithele typhae]
MSDVAPSTKKGSAFWLCFLAIILANLLSALDLTALSTAVPKIVEELNGGDNFVWIGSAYGLAATAILPFSGRLADVFGRRPVALLAIAIFVLGSALGGAAQSMNWLIAARTVQGIGGGAIVNLGSIVLSDLVPLAERGTYQSILVLVWALASGVGPLVIGALADGSGWRWVFYLNIPIASVSFACVAVFLNVKTPPGSVREKLGRVDWIGNFIVIAGTTLALIALTWAGVRFPWNSPHVLAPLVIGMALIVTFFTYEATIPAEPTVPLDLLSHRTALSGYISTFFVGITLISALYYLPVYFQACLGVSPFRSSVDQLSANLFSPLFSIIAGIVIKKTGRYLPINVFGWTVQIIGFSLLTLLKADSPTGLWVPLQMIAGAGVGSIWAGNVFPILAAVPVPRMAAALAFQNFVRSFGQTWGITICATILQNELKRRLPAGFLAQFPAGVEVAYAAIPLIPRLEEPLRTEVRVAFAESLAVVWKVIAGVAACGFVTLAILREVPMHTVTDDRFALQERRGAGGDSEAAVVGGETKEASMDSGSEKPL